MNRFAKHPRRTSGATPLSRSTALLLVVIGFGISLITVEVGARLWMALRWPAGLVEAMTQAHNLRGRFIIGPPTGYRLAPNFQFADPLGREYTHNSMGFRGAEFSREKPADTLRVVLMGGSTIYGLSVTDEDTAAVLALQQMKESMPGRALEVISAGVPGWTTEDTLLNLDDRILEFSPDYVVVMDGRNEMFPQIYNNYIDSYDHFRVADDEALRLQNIGWKRFFRVSRTALFLANRRPDWFGLRPHFENPVYGRIREENRPTVEEIHRHSMEPRRHRAFESNLRKWVERSRAAGAFPIFSTMVFDTNSLELGLMIPANTTPADLDRVVDRNNEIVRKLSRELEVPLIEGASLSSVEFLTDDCHFNEAGERAFARMISDVIISLASRPTTKTAP